MHYGTCGAAGIREREGGSHHRRHPVTLPAQCSMLMPVPKHPQAPAEDGERLAGPADQDIAALGGMGELSTFMPGPLIL